MLEPKDLMPTVRVMAVKLGINANSVARVYRQLQAEGVLRLRQQFQLRGSDGSLTS